MANLTLRLDDDVLQKARQAALREHTSVKALVRDYLTRYADTCSRRQEALDTLSVLAEGNKSKSTGRRSRDSLQQR